MGKERRAGGVFKQRRPLTFSKAERKYSRNPKTSKYWGEKKPGTWVKMKCNLGRREGVIHQTQSKKHVVPLTLSIKAPKEQKKCWRPKKGGRRVKGITTREEGIKTQLEK